MNRLRGGRYNDERQALPADSHAVALPAEGRMVSYDLLRAIPPPLAIAVD